MKTIRCLFLILVILSVTASGPVRAQCYGALELSSASHELDRLIRLSVHFGDDASLPEDIICSTSMLPGQTAVDVPIWAYNLHEGIAYLEFSVVSNESLGVFTPDNCFSIVGWSKSRSGNAYRYDLALQACGPAVGPVRVGYAQVVRVSTSDPVWIDLVPNGQTGKMLAIDIYGGSHSVFSPEHGGFVGMNYLYACQEPICEEPNTPATAFTAEKGPSCSVKLTWVSGSGNRTMIRYRTDRYPASHEDGELAVEVPTSPGESRFFFHTGMPNAATLYYKAFSLTRDPSDLIIRNSFVESSSLDTVVVKCVIGAEESSWGAIKGLFK